ncbi:MAG TPA: YlbF family regulator [Candidatus Limnocylindria bacterium]|nr:YlbF family regulator [Candidatus Limnocylindria bacterium]
MDYSAAHELARQLRESPEATEYRRLKAVVEESETTSALLKEYRRLQIAAQASALGGKRADAEDMHRLQQIASLLYAGTDTSRYLLAEMRLQQALADIYGIIAKAAGMSMDLPGMLET